MAGMMMIELEPPRIAPSIRPWSRLHPGRSPSRPAAMLTSVTTATAPPNVSSANSSERGAARESSCSRSALPPSNSTTTSVIAAKKGAMAPSISRLTVPVTGPSTMPARISQITSGTLVRWKTTSPGAPSKKMPAGRAQSQMLTVELTYVLFENVLLAAHGLSRTGQFVTVKFWMVMSEEFGNSLRAEMRSSPPPVTTPPSGAMFTL
jgi:hypothetical protein